MWNPVIVISEQSTLGNPCNSHGRSTFNSPVTRLVQQQFEKARNTLGGDKGELHVVKLENEGSSFSCR